MFTVSKQYRDFPAAHRQPNHDGHCRLIHGHNWGFDLVFWCESVDSNGFVLDVGKLGFIKEFLTNKFDHTLLLNEEDPYLGYLEDTLQEDNVLPYAKIVVVPNCGMEGLALYVFTQVDALLHLNMPEDVEKRKLRISTVTCWEDSKNAATYAPYSLLSNV